MTSPSTESSDSPPDVPETNSRSKDSVAYQLAAVHGDLDIVDEFQVVVDCIMASGIEGAETEERVGDTLYASWRDSAQTDTLLEWGQALCYG